MDQMHNLPQRQIFHEKLLEVEEYELSKKNKNDKWYQKTSKWFLGIQYKIYRALGFGYSIAKPSAFMAVYSIVFGVFYYAISSNPPKSIAYTLGNTLPFLSSSRKAATNFIDWKCEEICFHNDAQQTTVMMVGGFQTILSLVFLFLIGLALRNRFRIK